MKVGRHVNQVVAGRFGKAILELGGNNALIIDASADLDLAVRAVLFGCVGVFVPFVWMGGRTGLSSKGSKTDVVAAHQSVDQPPTFITQTQTRQQGCGHGGPALHHHAAAPAPRRRLRRFPRAARQGKRQIHVPMWRLLVWSRGGCGSHHHKLTNERPTPQHQQQAYGSVKIGDPLDATTLCGPLHNQAVRLLPCLSEFTPGHQPLRSPLSPPQTKPNPIPPPPPPTTGRREVRGDRRARAGGGRQDPRGGETCGPRPVGRGGGQGRLGLSGLVFFRVGGPVDRTRGYPPHLMSSRLIHTHARAHTHTTNQTGLLRPADRRGRPGLPPRAAGGGVCAHHVRRQGRLPGGGHRAQQRRAAGPLLRALHAGPRRHLQVDGCVRAWVSDGSGRLRELTVGPLGSFTHKSNNQTHMCTGPEGSDCGIVNVNIGTSGAEIGTVQSLKSLTRTLLFPRKPTPITPSPKPKHNTHGRRGLRRGEGDGRRARVRERLVEAVHAALHLHHQLLQGAAAGPGDQLRGRVGEDHGLI